MEKTERQQTGVVQQFLYMLAIAAVFLSSAVPALADPAELTTAFQESFPKYYAVKTDDGTEIQGLCIDILHGIEKITGFKIHASNDFIPFKRLQSQLASGQIDLFIGMAKNEVRLRKYIFLKTPLYEVKHIIVARRNDPVTITNFDDIRSLAPDNIILTNYSTATERLLKAQKGLRVDSEARSITANLKKLLYGRGRFLCFHDLGLMSTIEHEGYSDKIRIFPVIFKSYYHYIAFSPNTPDNVVQQINLAVQQMKTSGELEEIKARHVHSSF